MLQGIQKKRRKRRDRIAMISTHGYVSAEPPLGAPDTGGQVVFVLELSKKLAQLGYRVDIWTRQFEGQESQETVADFVTIRRVPCGGDEFIPKELMHRYIHQWIENAHRIIKREKLEYEFINSHYWDAGLAGRRLSEVLDVPHIHTPHSLGVWKKHQMDSNTDMGGEELEEKYQFGKRIREEMLIYREADLVVATSPSQVRVLVKEYEVPKEKLKMIPPGYDDNRFFPVSEASRRAIRERFQYDHPVVSSIGRLARNKGFDLLVDAFAFVAERCPNVMLRLAVGTESSDFADDDLMKEIMALVDKHGIRERVIFSGSISDEDLPDYYRAADVFVLSSRYEPFGMTAVEAMACGTPTVMTVHGGLYLAVDFGHEAIYADTTDRHELGVAILQALKYPRLRQKLSERGAHRARSLFTWTGIAQQLLAAVEGRQVPTFNDRDLSGQLFGHI